jgi:hypothetical protein
MKLSPICAAAAISLFIGMNVGDRSVRAQNGTPSANQPSAPQANQSAGPLTAQPNGAASAPSGGAPQPLPPAAAPAAVGGTGIIIPGSPPVNAVLQQPATSRAQATEQARVGAGRNNPFSGIEGGFQPFPSHGAHANVKADVSAATVSAPKTLARKRSDIGPFVPPPPPTAVGAVHESLAPPPPPEGSLDPRELPAPPDKPSIAAKLKLVAIIGDRALFTFTDPLMRDEHKWPHDISLGVGEMFENVSVVNVTPDSVTLEEDGDRSVRELPRIR